VTIKHTVSSCLRLARFYISAHSSRVPSTERSDCSYLEQCSFSCSLLFFSRIGQMYTYGNSKMTNTCYKFERTKNNRKGRERVIPVTIGLLYKTVSEQEAVFYLKVLRLSGALSSSKRSSSVGLVRSSPIGGRLALFLCELKRQHLYTCN